MPACHLSGRGSLMLELSHGWAATPSSMQSLLLSTWTVLPGWSLFIFRGSLSLTTLLPERVEETLVAKAGFAVLLDPVSDPTSLSPPRTEMTKACYTCALGHCGVSEELHYVLSTRTASSWEDQVLWASQQYPSLTNRSKSECCIQCPSQKQLGLFRLL